MTVTAKCGVELSRVCTELFYVKHVVLVNTYCEHTVLHAVVQAKYPTKHALT